MSSATRFASPSLLGVVSGVQRGRASGRPARDKLIEKTPRTWVSRCAVGSSNRYSEACRPAREADALLLTAGQLARPPVGQLADVQQGEDPPRLGLGLGLGDASAPHRVGHRVKRRQVRPQGVVLEHHADIGAPAARPGVRRLLPLAQPDAPLAGGRKPATAFSKPGLSRAGRPSRATTSPAAP